MTFFVLSYTAALDALADGTMKKDDLKTAIFCLGCGSKFPFLDPEHIVAEQEPWQKHPLKEATVKTFAKALTAAEKDKRVIWRYGGGVEPVIVHQKISAALQKAGMEPLNPNLPPIVENGFLKLAVERTRNVGRGLKVICS